MPVLVMKARHPEEERDQAHLLSKKMEAEYATANPTKRQGKKILKQEFKRGKQQLSEPVHDRESYRRHILSISLFPNVWNNTQIMSRLDAAY